MKKHLIIATYDGIGTHYSGVGTIAKNFVDSLPELAEKFDLRVSIAYINVDQSSKVFNKDCFDRANKLTSETGGIMIPLCNSTRGESEWDMWRSFNEWNYACNSLVTALNIVLNPNEESYIILNDTPFLFFAKYKNLVASKKVKYFYFPLSTGKNHAFGDQSWRNNRIRVEQECFDLISRDKDSKIIALGRKFADRMSKDYDLSFSENDFLQNGLFFSRYHDYLSKKFTNADLEKFGIHIGRDAKIIFAWGRCSVAKGFRELARAWKISAWQLPDHYLILQIPNNSGEPNYFLDIQSILSDTPRSIIIDDFDPDIWKNVLRNENTDIVCVPSIMDPFPHTSIEAKLFSRDMNYVTMISEVDGAVDAFSKDESIYFNPKDVEQFSKKIIDAANLGQNIKKEMNDKNKATIGRFDFPMIMRDFIVQNIK